LAPFIEKIENHCYGRKPTRTAMSCCAEQEYNNKAVFAISEAYNHCKRFYQFPNKRREINSAGSNFLHSLPFCEPSKVSHKTNESRAVNRWCSVRIATCYAAQRTRF